MGLMLHLTELYSELDDLVVRELMNGMWFLLSLEMLAALTFYLARSFYEHQNQTVRWYQDGGVQLAVALSVYMVGAAIRSGWIWILLECQNEQMDCSGIQSFYVLLALASACAIIGGVCCIRVMLPEAWRPWSWVVPGVAAACVPIAVHIW